MDPAISLARVPRRPLPSDLLVAGGVLTWALLEAALAHGPGTRVARVGFALLISVPLVVRRRAPLAVMVVICVTTVVRAVTADVPESGVMPFPALLVAIFSVALYARTAAMAVAGWALAVTAMIVTMHSPYYDSPTTVGNTSILLFFTSGTWTAGWLVRRRAEHARRAYEESGEVARSAVADERSRIARELHDVVAHGISIISVQSGAAEQLLDQDPAAAREHLKSVRRTARETMGEMRRLLQVLREEDPVYDPQPGLSRLPDLLDESRAAGVEVKLRQWGEPRELPAGIDLVAYRVIQEALTNVRKHAPGYPAQVALGYGRRELSLEVRNDAGADATVTRNGAGHGLIGMGERVRIFGGHLETGPLPDGGFRVHAVLPLDEDGL